MGHGKRMKKGRFRDGESTGLMESGCGGGGGGWGEDGSRARLRVAEVDEEMDGVGGRIEREARRGEKCER